jgi:hypothetical protein
MVLASHFGLTELADRVAVPGGRMLLSNLAGGAVLLRADSVSP